MHMWISSKVTYVLIHKRDQSVRTIISFLSPPLKEGFYASPSNSKTRAGEASVPINFKGAATIK